MRAGRYEYANETYDPELNFIDVHGDDGYVSCAEILDMLNAPGILASSGRSVAIYYLPHTNQFVVECNGQDIIDHDMYSAIILAAGITTGDAA